MKFLIYNHLFKEIFLSMAQKPLVERGFLITEASRSQTHHNP